MFSRDITVDTIAANNKKYVLIDVRSPGEYKEATIPGAVNVPLFTDDERAIIGTTYKNEGKNQAKWKGMEIVSPKLPKLMQEIKNYVNAEQEPVLFCWRGGMRSMSMATFAAMSGLPIQRLQGGYRSYRQYVTEHLSSELLPRKTYALHGMTGVGKTLILNQLARWGEPVLDLEEYAGHRGSVFGSVGIKEKNQKMFDALLFTSLMDIKSRGFSHMFMEAESRRIGRIVVPEFMMEAKANGVHFLVKAPVELRVERIYQDYIEPNKDEEWFFRKVSEAYQLIAKRMETSARNDCYRYLIERKYRHFIRTLLTVYYDPRYTHKEEAYSGEFISIDAANIERAAREIQSYAKQ
ncbi:tRNA 2-selenouridine(34) synthase MnmH [Aneurinibacillus terranovensis]|uniref:tRNA 2-selenouridine(34) synthase MnmH n=1 Tax=Aneurinibacillus terranovensis TaxID=278991 RepID=UPI0004105189|nr:tRNA 2-selenouridine(34) synthase MnmH [Aneurinibacillus terranovensis]